MENLEATIEAAVKDGIIPGAVMQAVNTSGSFRYSKAIGLQSIEDGTPLSVDSVFRIASCTKLMTSIAAMQCVERGQIGLDDDLAGLLPEIAKLDVIAYDDQGKVKPQLEKRKNAITLRRLITHSSGVGYPQFTEHLAQQVAAAGNEACYTAPTVAGRYGVAPLLFEPGTEWMYGAGIDWVGQLVERLNGNVTLEEYLQQNVWGPLGIKDITFFPKKRADMQSRMTGMTDRTADGKIKASESFNTENLQECFGGQGGHASMPDYLKMLHSILADDEKILKKETCRMMLAPQLEKGAKESFHSLRPGPSIFDFFIGEYSESLGLDYGLGSMVTTTEEPGWRGKGTLTWSGLPNMFWYVDRQNGLCGIFGTQVTPPGDRACAKLITLFEKTMQQRAKESS